MNQYPPQPPYYAPPPVQRTGLVWIPRTIALLYACLSIASFGTALTWFIRDQPQSFGEESTGRVVLMAALGVYFALTGIGIWKLKKGAAVLATMLHGIAGLIMCGMSLLGGYMFEVVLAIMLSIAIVVGLMLPPVRRLFY